MNRESKPLALCLADAAAEVGMSKPQFRRLFLDTKRLRSIHTGKRDRIIDYAELRAAYEQYVNEQRGETH